MSTPLITVGPTLSNPEAFDSVEALRTELHRVNTELLAQAASRDAMRGALRFFANTLSGLLLAYLQQDSAKVAELLAQAVKDHLPVAPLNPKPPTH